MDEWEPEYIIRCQREILDREVDHNTAIDLAYEVSEARPNEPVEVKRSDATHPIFWRVVDR